MVGALNRFPTSYTHTATRKFGVNSCPERPQNKLGKQRVRRSTLLQAHATQLGLWQASVQPWCRLTWAGLDAWAPSSRTRASTRVTAWRVRSTTASIKGTFKERWHGGYTSCTTAGRTTPSYDSTVPAPKNPTRSKMGGAEQPTRHHAGCAGRTRTYNAIFDPIVLPLRGP